MWGMSDTSPFNFHDSGDPHNHFTMRTPRLGEVKIQTQHPMVNTEETFFFKFFLIYDVLISAV